MNKNVVINGSNSFIGKKFCEFLARKGYKVFAISRNKVNFDDSLNISEFTCDLQNIDLMANKLPANLNYLAFFDFAWIGTGEEKKSVSIQSININTSLKVFEVASKIGSKKFIGSGSFFEKEIDWYLEPENSLKIIPEKYIYGIFKNTVSKILKMYSQKLSMDFIWLNISNVYGPNENSERFICYLIKKIISGNSINVSKGNYYYDFLYIDDAVKVLEKIIHIQPENWVFNLCSDKPMLFKNYMNIIKKTLNYKKIYLVNEDSSPLLKLDDFKIDNIIKLNSYTSFDEGIKKTYEWRKNNKYTTNN